MSDLAPLPGDPRALAGAAERLGSVASVLRSEGARFHEGSRLATLAVLRSDAALRITALTDGLRGIDAEYSRVETSGVRVARLLADHARAWQLVEDELEALRADVARATRAADESAAAPHGLAGAGAALDAERARRTTQDAQALAVDLKRTMLLQRAALVDEVRGVVAGYDPAWTDVPAAALAQAAMETPMRAVGRRLADGTAVAADAWAAMDDAYAEVADDDSRESRSSATYQVLGGLDELGTTLSASIGDTGHALAHPLETLESLGRLGWDLQTDPLHTAAPLVHEFVDPVTEQWAAGEQGRAVGHGLASVLELALGGKGVGTGLRTARDGAVAERAVAGGAALREAHEAVRLRRLGTHVAGTRTWSFGSEAAAARAMAHPVAGSTYRVHFEGLPSDYVFGNHGELIAIRGPLTLLRKDVPVPPPEARAMVQRLETNGWKQIPGIKGGRRWKNLSGREKDSARLPALRADGAPAVYYEFDISAPTAGIRGGRGLRRIVRDSENHVWYTDDHYKTFVRIK